MPWGRHKSHGPPRAGTGSSELDQLFHPPIIADALSSHSALSVPCQQHPGPKAVSGRGWPRAVAADKEFEILPTGRKQLVRRPPIVDPRRQSCGRARPRPQTGAATSGPMPVLDNMHDDSAGQKTFCRFSLSRREKNPARALFCALVSAAHQPGRREMVLLREINGENPRVVKKPKNRSATAAGADRDLGFSAGPGRGKSGLPALAW